MFKRWGASLGVALVAVLTLCGGSAAAGVVDLSQGEVSIKLESGTERVVVAEDFMLTITVEAPERLQVTIPDLRERFSGFSTAEDFTLDPVVVGGRTRLVQRWRLVPEPAARRYRLAPFAVTVVDKGQAGAAPHSFATRPVLFPAPDARVPVTGEPEVVAEPITIRPTARMIATWVVMGVAALGVVVLLLYGLSRLGRRVREMRMSAGERAMSELQRLLRRNLPQRGLFKEFYIELTMVVRRYIERTRGIRAPGQTTQEFLAAAVEHPEFTAGEVAQLKTFLESADLVKFAGQKATITMAESATERAREYISAAEPKE